MSIFRKISEKFYYYFDSMNAAGLKVKVDHFILDSACSNIIVVYRVGRQKLLNKMSLSLFEKEYFGKISNYDQHRLTKFSTLQSILQNLFIANVCSKDHFINFIEVLVKNEQPF